MNENTGKWCQYEVYHMKLRDGYKYYSYLMPIDINTYPIDSGNKVIKIFNYDEDTRIPVNGEDFCAWGEIIYDKPLTKEQLENSELLPSRKNPDIIERIKYQTQIVGEWESKYRILDVERYTWWYPEFGIYVLNDFISIKQLAERFKLVEKFT